MSAITTPVVLPAPVADDRGSSALRLEAVGVSHAWRDGRVALRDVSLSVAPGELVAIAGRSGSGKSTLLAVLAGQLRATQGEVRHTVQPVPGMPAARVGLVPQDDIVHRNLPVRSVLRHAARLRLAASLSRAELDQRVEDIIVELGLAGVAQQRVGTLSGGQRKRVCIGVELLDRPGALLLDEPTSGLDPLTAAALLETLRQVASRGATVMLTTHHIEDVRRSDTLVFVANGRVAYAGAVDDAAATFGVADLDDVYRQADRTGSPEDRLAPLAPAARPRESSPSSPRSAWATGSGRLRSVATLVHRNLELMRYDRLGTAIMLGSPAAVLAMFLVLFEGGAAAQAGPASTVATMTAFWLSFAAFFFGLTYGLLQVVTEVPIMRSERFVGVRAGAQLAAKIVVLAPVLLAVVSAMVLVLGACDRLPERSNAESIALVVTLQLTALAALALGLLASSLVREAAQATLALPMLCFPAVLFSGGVLPVHDMAIAGRVIAALTPNRWAYEAVGQHLGLDVGSVSVAGARLALAGFAVVFVLAAVRALGARTGQGTSTR